MPYLRLELDGFEHLDLASITSLTMDFHSSAQLILGTNGCGKSSVLREISLLPANSSDFHPNGKKIITRVHQGRTYVLSSISDHRRVMKHSFVVDDGENLNPGGTQSVQKKLIEEHFSMTSDVHSLLLGRERFTGMSALKRKEWLMRFAKSDYDYALNAYNKIKDALRDEAGAIKSLNKRLTEESAKILDPDQEQEELADVAELQTIVQFLLERRIPVTKAVSDLQSFYTRQIEALEEKSTRLIGIFAKPHQLQNYDPHRARQEHDEHATAVIELKTRLSTLRATHEDIMGRVRILQNSEQTTIDAITVQLEQLQLEINEKQSGMFSIDIGQDPGSVLGLLINHTDTVSLIMSGIGSNPERKYNQQYLRQMEESVSELRQKSASITSELKSKRQELEHMLSHNHGFQTNCPQCDHTFTFRMTNLTSDQLINRVKRLEEDFVETEQFLAKALPELDRARDYMTYAYKLMTLIGETALLKPFWDYLTFLKIIHNDPVRVPALWQQFIEYTQTQVSLSQLIKQREEFITLKNNLAKVEGVSLSELVTQGNSIAVQISDTTEQLIEKNKQVHDLRNWIDWYDEVKRQEAQLTQDMEKIEAIRLEYLEMARRNDFNEVTTVCTSLLGEKEAILNRAKSQKALITALQQQIDKSTIQHARLDALARALSPNEGLIAKGLFSFMPQFVREINQIIASIWMYPLEVMPCKVDSDGFDLDFKFPIKKGYNSKVADDVSLGSESMKEVIDLAFRIAAAKFLDLQDFPLFLDEFGITFDKVHREQATHVIRSLIDQRVFSQIFIISHYPEVTDALPEADVCVLSPMNIVTPQCHKPVNYHVRIE